MICVGDVKFDLGELNFCDVVWTEQVEGMQAWKGDDKVARLGIIGVDPLCLVSCS